MTRQTFPILVLAAIGCSQGIAGNPNGTDMPDAGPVSCQNGQNMCSTVCVDLLNDAKNCGECGVTCGVDECHRGYCRCLIDDDCQGGEQCRFNLCRKPDSNGASCLKDAECGEGRICAAGYCTTAICDAEVCDGWDNDCDGKTDEPEDTTMPCYTGPKGTEGVGECHGGATLCVGGKPTCEGQQVPVSEKGVLTCDAKDNNCDGCVDGAGGTLGCDSLIPPFFDFVFMIDTSGSMFDDMDAVKEVVGTFSKQFAGNDRIHAGIMNISTEIPPTFISIVQPMSDWTDFKAALDTVEYSDTHSLEASWDAIYQTASGVYDAELKFRPDSLRIFIVLTDETAQSYIVPMRLKETTACAPVIAHDVLLSVVTLPKFYADWDACAPMRTFPLSTDIAMVVKNLNSILVLPCFGAL